eukprot:6183576-Pleurochrysis_carterae.AAC.4
MRPASTAQSKALTAKREGRAAAQRIGEETPVRQGREELGARAGQEGRAVATATATASAA